MVNVLLDGVVVDMDLPEPQPQTEEEGRANRDNLLARTDTWALSDRTMTEAQTAYRQALRDITGQSGFPSNINWPELGGL
tara:strand:- start:1425 stop:1664 length:240 start_codon:yes stop_codon:yes gene_type:complete